jgi:selenocysteine-specific elongation factor
VRKSHFSAVEIAESLKKLQSRGEIVICREIAANARAWRMWRSRAAALIDSAHENNSARAGLDVNALRARLPGLPLEIFELLLSDLCSDGFVRNGSIIARASHRAALSPHLKTIAGTILATLAREPSDPPARKQIAPDKRDQEALRFLIDQGEVIELGPDVILSRESFARMKDGVVAFISEHQSATVSQLRQELQSSRRIIVPFLEKLDRDGVTRRVDDQRILADQVERDQHGVKPTPT